MPRARKIKPSYMDSKAIEKLSFGARLLDINLWTHLDGNGMIEDSVASIKSKVFPRDDISGSDVASLIIELVRGGRLFSLEVENKRWLYRKDFRKEQRIYADEPRFCKIDPELLRNYDEGNTIPQSHILDGDIQPQLFSTSSSSFSSTFTSSSPSSSLTQENKNLGEKTGLKTPWLEVPRVEAPSGFFDRFKRGLSPKRAPKVDSETPESVGELIEQAIGRRA